MICSNNQAEQFAVLKALETIESLNNNTINPRKVIIYAESRVSLDSLSNPKKPCIPSRKDQEKGSKLREQ